MSKQEEIRQYCNIIDSQLTVLCRMEEEFMGTETAGLNISDPLYSIVCRLDEAVTEFSDLIKEVGE